LYIYLYSAFRDTCRFRAALQKMHVISFREVTVSKLCISEMYIYKSFS